MEGDSPGPPWAHVGLIGVGEMGRPMVANLLAAGYRVTAFDLDAQRLNAAVTLGAQAATDAAALLRACDCVMTSLPSSESWVRLADSVLVPQARHGQTVIDLGTVVPHETRRIAHALAQRGATLLDAPCSGGAWGVEQKQLRVFVGGDRQAFERALPMLRALGGGEGMIHYCGRSGAGQVVKGVNQLMMGLVVAAQTEAVAFGVNCGVDADLLAKAVGGDGWLRGDFTHIAQQAAAGKGRDLGVKFRELPYYLREAAEQRFPLPITQAIYAACEPGERVVIDDHRPAPSFWHELTKGRR